MSLVRQDELLFERSELLVSIPGVAQVNGSLTAVLIPFTRSPALE